MKQQKKIKRMERRKLFSVATRRRLFSSSPIRRKLFSDRTLVCRDCGHEVHTDAVTTNIICSNCGSSRFNVKEEEKKFSSLTEKTPNAKGITGKVKSPLHTFKCYDCKEHFTSPSNTPSGVCCPNCGGSRVVQLEDVIADDATDEIMKEYSGVPISPENLQKIFTERGVTESIDSLVNSGYASIDEDGMVCFSEGAWLTRKLFSELVISVTKELHLTPTEGKIESLIHGLEERGNISPKGIVLVKKAHGILPVVRETSFSETEAYIKDSGLENDLKLEYSGKTLPLKEFMEILNTQYNDAPDDLLDKLVSTGIVKIEGSTVEIN